jgi:hypothetical protein
VVEHIQPSAAACSDPEPVEAVPFAVAVDKTAVAVY